MLEPLYGVLQRLQIFARYFCGFLQRQFLIPYSHRKNERAVVRFPRSLGRARPRAVKNCQRQRCGRPRADALPKYTIGAW
jgi:hypothetical protein